MINKTILSELWNAGLDVTFSPSRGLVVTGEDFLYENPHFSSPASRERDHDYDLLVALQYYWMECTAKLSRPST